MEPKHLLHRLDEIGHSLERSEHALALIGLGSSGLELDRLDAYSDLDFFVIVEKGYKRSFLLDLQWLSDIRPIAYCFPNTDDGYKLLFEDGIFCEFAIFEPDELRAIPFAAGRIVWIRPELPDTLGQPASEPVPASRRSKDWLLGEALTNLYVGLQRDRRGEKLSAMRFIQGYALDRLLELAEYVEEAGKVPRDPFANERRFEQRFPALRDQLPAWAQGYAKNRASALAILAFLEAHFEVSEVMAKEIRALCS